MPDTLLAFLPVTAEDADSVRARFDADANAGLDPSDPSYLDTTEGGFYWDLTQAAVLEAVRLWDFLGTEVVAAAFPGTAWGDYLDMHGETVNLPRDDEVQATGTVLFTGAAGTLIASATQVSTQQPDPSAATQPVVFTTDRTITLAVVPGPVNLVAGVSASGGILPAGTYYYAVTAIGPNGETIASNEVTVTLSGAASRVDLSWTAFAGATQYNVYRGTVVSGETLLATMPAAVKVPPTGVVATPFGTGGTLAAGTRFYVVTAFDAAGETVKSTEVNAVVPAGGTGRVVLTWNRVEGALKYRVYEGATGAENVYWEVGGALLTFTEVGGGSTGGTPPVANTTVATDFSDTGGDALGITLVPTNSVSITAADPGSAGNVGAGTITQVLSPINGAPGVTNTQATSGGADVESDARYRLRIAAEYGKASGAGNISDYIKWALQVPQVGYATVQPLWAGAGTVRVIITDQNNHPNSTSIVAALQTTLDPVAGQGQGLAPIGAIVTVATPSLLVVATVATITHDSGYTLDGSTGTVPTRAAITTAVQTYLNTLPPGQPAVLYAVLRQIMSVPGVHDVSAFTLNGVATNVAVGALQVASAGTVTLS